MKKIVVFIIATVFSTNVWAQKLIGNSFKEGELLIQLTEAYPTDKLEIDFTKFNLKNQGLISKHLNIYQFVFDTEKIAQDEILNKIKTANGVLIAQNNHIIHQRQTFPNDNVPWQFHNTATDADVDATEVWDYGVGDFTAQGDPLVVAIVDGGFSINDPDMDYWQNTNEIANNGIDDDGNGYIDDIGGWNIADTSSIITSGGGHGQFVSAIIGAIGNNGTGNTGICWGTQVLPLEIFNSSLSYESRVLAAFDYMLNERIIYDATNGADGAFIVSSNHSYGEGGFPSDAPLWCAAYDVAGQLGILSAGATWNNFVDVDVVGDLPTSCTEDHLITVTATDQNDNHYNAGYGLTSIDLGSPSNGSTSEATPVVAGTVPLLLSTACPSFIQLYKDYPDSISLLIKDYILSGVDQITDLQGITVTGGRLNAFNSMKLLLSEQCGQAFPPIVKIDYSDREVCPGQSIQFTDISLLSPTSWSWSFPGGSPSTSSSANPSIIYNTPGTYDVTLTISNANGSSSHTISNLIQVSALSGNSLPYLQDFETGNDWTITNPNNDTTWTLTNDPNCNGTVFTMDNFGENNANTSDYLTASFDLTNIPNGQLIFDVAYAQYDNTYTDELNINVISCGASDSIVYNKSGSILATAPDTTGAFTPSDCTQWRTDTVYLAHYAGQIITIQFINNSNWGNVLYLDNIQVVGDPLVGPFRFNTKVLLEGPYDANGKMHTSLTSIIPLTQPYSTAPYNYAGTENIANIPNNMVDWILIEARVGAPSISGSRTTTTIETHAAILLDNGEIMGTDGQLGVEFTNLGLGQNYHFCIRHRNHLDVLTGNPLTLDNNMFFNFATNINQAFGPAQQKTSTDGYPLLWAGDFTQNLSIQNLDYDHWKENPAQLNVYAFTDANLDGVVQVTDFDFWYPNRSKVGIVEIEY